MDQNLCDIASTNLKTHLKENCKEKTNKTKINKSPTSNVYSIIIIFNAL